MKYDPKKDNYEEAMFREHHLSQTQNAIRRFLYGFTKYTGDPPSGGGSLESTGWVSLMARKDAHVVKKVLVKPRGKSRTTLFNLRESLWL